MEIFLYTEDVYSLTMTRQLLDNAPNYFNCRFVVLSREGDSSDSQRIQGYFSSIISCVLC